jgi:Flavodoxin reductases (ferredoxin-NADPH reductases) family 1
MSLEWQHGTVTELVDETHNTRRFFIRANELTVFDFKPGQFVTLDLPIHEKKNKRLRSYSIASCPNGTNEFELIIVLVEDGLGTPYLFNDVKVGDQILFRGPIGVFTMERAPQHDLFLICTGTGIAPFRSMITSWHRCKMPSKNIYLIFGTRTQQDLLYHEEFCQLANEMPGLHYIPVLSREQWSGRTGYVHAVYEELCKGKPDAHFMLCGWKNMIDDARAKLATLGYPKSQVHFELYG